MSDALLGRIATALEALVAKAGAEVKKVEAEVVAEVAKVAKPRGRPAKGEEIAATVTAAATSTVTPTLAPAVVVEEEDPFALAPAAPVEPEKKLELTDVREAIVAYQKRANSPEKARGLLKTYGGVDALASLPPEKFRAVYDAAKAA